MADVTRNIGLSLGADICWPASYEEIIKRLDLAIPVGDDVVRFAVDRVTVTPFDLEYKTKYHLVLDRLTHWFSISREWVKKIAIMDGTYVLNNPWAIQSMEKHTTYAAMMRLGMPIPKTWMIPPKEYDESFWDTGVTVRRYNRLFDLSKVGEQVGYPAYLKPYDGGGWVGVQRVKTPEELHAAYNRSGQRVHHLQAAVPDWDLFVRCIGIGPQMHVVKYDPDAPLHGRYTVAFNFMEGDEYQRAIRITRVINAFFGWDFNSCEMLRSSAVLHPIDFANACPDSQVTSLHYHFPWLVTSLLKWSIFCAATARKKPLTMWWDRFFEVADGPGTFDEKLEKYDAIAKEYFAADEFAAFCDKHLADLDRVAWEFFGTPRFKEIVREKVSALYPTHEIDQFTNHFFGLVQFWRKTEGERRGFIEPVAASASPEAPAASEG